MMFSNSSKNQISPEKCEEIGLSVMHIDTMAGKKINSKINYVTAMY